MCAGFEHGGGSCKGDSGGPLLKYDHNTLEYKQIGIVQGGVSNCGDQYFHNIYVRVDEGQILNFINTVTTIQGKNKTEATSNNNEKETSNG